MQAVTSGKIVHGEAFYVVIDQVFGEHFASEQSSDADF